LIYAARSVASSQRQRIKSAGQRRLALLGFAALLVLLFVGFAVAEGIGDPSISSDDVAIVEDAPEDIGTISKAQLDHAIVVAAAAQQVEPVPKPGDEQYDDLMKAALGELLDSIWIQGQAEEMGFSVTPEEVEKELEKLKSQAFKTEKQFQEFLKESHYTQEDIDQRVTLQILSTKIQDQLTEQAPVPSSDEIEEYYEEAKSSQYTTPESRDFRIVVNKDKAKVEEAKTELEKDDSTESWEKVTKRFSTDPATKSKGGLQSSVTEGQGTEPLNGEVFAAEEGEIRGPLKESRGWVVFEVMTINKPRTSLLEEVKSQISSTLAEQASQQAFARFLRNYNSTWTSRTFCADGYEIERCANFEGDGRSTEADPACYEADPKKAAEACPAPVTQVKSAQPGSTTLLTPEGQKLTQRPRPAGEETALPESTELPPGVVPGG
jgi:foldase protein PrsA